MNDLDRMLALRPSAGLEAESAEAADSRPRVLAEGDSWLAYPKSWLFAGPPANVVDWLRKWGRWRIDDVSSSGDEAVAMLSGAKKLDLLERLNRKKYDIILFSGGGNDIVGAYDFPFMIEVNHGQGTQKALHQVRLDRRLSSIANAYLDLIDYTRESVANRLTPIVTHVYDICPPSPQGAAFLGGAINYQRGRSWMHPWLVEKGWTDPEDQKEIVRDLLGHFRRTLLHMARNDERNFHVVDTHGTLTDGEWLNEIHPTSHGFMKIARRIEDGMIEVLGREALKRGEHAP